MLEREDMDQLHRSCDKHGWAGTVFVRDDAEAVYRELLGDENAVMSDELWERVRETRAWRKAIVEAMTDAAWPVVQMAVEEAMGGEQVMIGKWPSVGDHVPVRGFPCLGVYNFDPMSGELSKAMAMAEKLPKADQDALAAILVQEMQSEKRWAKAFKSSQSKLSRLASEALAEHRAGKTRRWK